MKKIRVAILGLGRSGRGIHGNYLSQDPGRFQVMAAVDPIKARREWAGETFGCETYRDHHPLLTRDDVDLVVNATPSKFHVPYSLEFLEAGFNVLCEKPLAQRASDVDLLIAASRAAGKTFAVFQQSRYAPYFRQVRKVIGSGVLGDLVQICIAFNGFSRRYDWQTLREEMAGGLLNTGPHPLDQALQLFGTDRMPDVRCYMRNTVAYGDADDHTLLILSGSDRPLVHLEISSCCAYPCFTYNIYGTLGGLKGGMQEMEWRYFEPKEAPRLRLVRKPLTNEDGTPGWCRDSLRWKKRTWRFRPKGGGKSPRMFETMSSSFYRMLYRTLTRGTPLEIRLEEVRQQIAVIEEAQRQNPHLW